MMKKIVLIGPESTGKTTLAKQLAKHYDTVWVEEYARTYIDQLNRPYEQHDLLNIAQGQLLAEAKKEKVANAATLHTTATHHARTQRSLENPNAYRTLYVLFHVAAVTTWNDVYFLCVVFQYACHCRTVSPKCATHFI